MDKDDFFKILCTSTPEELNEFIALKGKKKMVNAITFIDQESKNTEELKNTKNDEVK